MSEVRRFYPAKGIQRQCLGIFVRAGGGPGDDSSWELCAWGLRFSVSDLRV